MYERGWEINEIFQLNVLRIPRIYPWGGSSGHFYVSAFLRNSVTGKIVYINVGDVRAQICGKWSLDNVLYREAKDDKDYRGGHNMFVPLPQLLERVLALTER